MFKIDSIKALNICLKHDREAMKLVGKSILKEYLKGNTDDIKIYHFVVRLRIFELIEYRYRVHHSFLNSLLYILYKHYFYRIRRNYGLFISPGVFGSGLRIAHFGYIWADTQAKVGKNCTILPRVLLGKRQDVPSPHIIIGDNVLIGTGSTILGPVKIGNNVIIGAGALVKDDIPNNAIVAGVPARILKIRET